MPSRVIVLSGPVASGKTTLAKILKGRFNCHLFKTRDLIATALGTRPERFSLQRAGDRLDRETGGRWVAEAVARNDSLLSENAVLVIDSVRIKEQIDAIRDAFGAIVVHVHLTASLARLSERYVRRNGAVRELSPYEQVRRNRTERLIERLSDHADIVIDTERSTPDDVAVRVASRLGFFGKEIARLVDVIIGGQYGSEGKGQVASYLAPEYNLLVRVGGPNAGHKVYQNPEPYTFCHLPSGTARSEAKLILGPGAVLWVPDLMKEIADCHVTADRLSIDPRAMIIEPADRTFEKRLQKLIGSTGQGVGAATARKVLRLAAKPLVRLAAEIKELKPFLRDTQPLLDVAFSRGERVLLEGTQGTALSLHHGYYPYVTSRDTTVSGCLSEAGIPPARVRRVVMTCRTYPIRVRNPKGGTSGYMSRELKWRDIAERSGVPLRELLEKEKGSRTHRRRRVGEFDWVLLRRSASLNGPTDIAVTFVDYISITNRAARRFEQLTPDTIRFIEEIERVTEAPVSLISTRFHFRNIIDRRSW